MYNLMHLIKTLHIIQERITEMMITAQMVNGMATIIPVPIP